MTLVDVFNAAGWQFDEERQYPIACRKALLDNLPANVHYLQNSFVVLDVIKIYGRRLPVMNTMCLYFF